MNDDKNKQHAEEAARRGDDMANPNTRGTRQWFEWEDAYKDQRRAEGKDYQDGAPPGCPAW
jgi:hypothetical protein